MLGCTQEWTVTVKEVIHGKIYANITRLISIIYVYKHERPTANQYLCWKSLLKLILHFFMFFCLIFSPQMSPSQDQASSLRVLCSSIIKRAPFPIQSVTIATRPWPSATCRPPSLLAVVRWEERYIAIIRWGFIYL